MLKFLLILLVIDIVINRYAFNYIENDAFWGDGLKHIFKRTPANIIYHMTEYLKNLLIIWIVLELILLIF